MTPDQEARARAALEQKLAELNQAPAVPTPVAPVVAAPAPAPAVTVPPPVVPAPAVPTPAVAVPASTKTGLERLAELTELYLANQITPAQYHQERAKIVQSLNK
jgi:hypothetical protein